MSATLAEFKKAAVINTLRSCQLFTGLPPLALEKIAEVSVLKSLEKNEYFFREGNPSPGFFVVQSGAVNVHQVNALGQEQVIHIFRAGESFAEATLAAPKGCHADARAVVPTRTLLIARTVYRPHYGLKRKRNRSPNLRSSWPLKRAWRLKRSISVSKSSWTHFWTESLTAKLTSRKRPKE